MVRNFHALRFILVDSLHLRARQSPTKKEPLSRIYISNSFMNTPLLPPSTWGTRVFVDAWLTPLQVISLFLVVWKSLSSWSDLMNTPLVYKFIIESVPICLSVVLLLLTLLHFRSGVSYYVVITAVFVASVIAMTDERVRPKITHHQ